MMAQGLQVIPVPCRPNDPAVPHPTYNGHKTTFKAIARGCDVTKTYTASWDFDGDNTYDWSQTYTPNSTTRSIWDIGTTYTVPTYSTNTLIIAKVRVVESGSGTTVYANYPYYVRAWSPSPDPRNWTDEQVEVMTESAIEESMWYLHRRMTGFAGYNTANIIGYFPASDDYDKVGIPLYLSMFLKNGRYPAYPTGSYSHGTSADVLSLQLVGLQITIIDGTMILMQKLLQGS